MDIQFHCYQCGQKLSVEEEGTGSEINCPTCRTALVIPSRSHERERPDRVPEVVHVYHDTAPAPRVSSVSRGAYRVLAFFLGLAGIHNMYTGFMLTGFFQLAVSLTGVGLVLTVPWVLMELLFQSTDGRGLKME